MSKTRRRSRVPYLIILVAIAVVIGLVAYKASTIHQGAVPIVTAPSTELTISPTETTLETLAETPTDIDVDYIEIVDEPTIVPIYKVEPIDPNIVNIMLVGYDARPGETIGRSDTMMIASYNRTTQAVKLISLMRDSWVPIEGHDWNRLNAAYAYGGVGLLINTVNNVFDLDIQGYAIVRFEQLIEMVDDLGGIDIPLTAAEIAYINKSSPDNPLTSSAGVKHLDGKQTLVHSRNRKVGDGDFSRTLRQRQVLLAMFEQLRSGYDVGILSDLIDNTRTNIGYDDILDMAIRTLDQGLQDMGTARMPFDQTWAYANKDGRSVLAIDLDLNRDLLHQLIYGEMNG